MPLMSRTLLALLWLVALPLAAAEPVRAVPALDLSRYAGQWHEIARLPMVFQKHCRGEITANYGLREDGQVDVHNRCAVADGGYSDADGVARLDPDHPAQLQVRFAPDWLAWLPPVWADYWVIALDPDYQWAMVGEPKRRYLWILARTPHMPQARFEQLKAEAARMGYDLTPLIVSAPLR
jgi:apolipoprotein D and lipocalin family protein